MIFVKKLFTPPTFDDEEKTHQAYLLNTILLALIILPIPYLIYSIFQPSQETSRALVFILVAEIINITPFMMLRYGYVRLASVIQVISLWSFFAFISITAAGIYGIAYILGSALVITISGILLGGRGTLIMTLLVAIEGGLMVYAESRGWKPPDILDEPFPTWMVTVVLFTVGAILQHLSSRTLRTALNRAKESEEKYRLISQVSTDYVFASKVDKDGNAELNWVAGAFEKMTGYSQEEYTASGGWVAHIHPDDAEKDAEDMRKLLNNEDVIYSEIRTFAKNGEIRWERSFAHPVWSKKENRLIGIIGAVQDVTHQKKIEESLKETLLQQAALLNNIPDIAWLKDKEGRYIAVNEQLYKFMRMDQNDIIGKTDFDISPKELAEIYRESDRKVMESKQRISIEEQMTDANQNIIWVETIKTPIFNSAGEVVGTTGISHDITERKSTEIREQRRQTMLEKVLRLGQQVTEVSDFHVALKNIWHDIRYELDFDRLAIFLYNHENKTMDATYGANDLGEMVETWGISFPLSEDSTFMQVLERPDGLYLTHNYDEENKIPAGHEMYDVKDFASVAAWAGEKPVAVICVDMKISQRRISDEQLEALRLFAGYAGLAIENARLNDALQHELAQRQTLIGELEAKNTELERFTYTVSHDLKSPLVTITGFLSYLEKDARAGNFDKFKADAERIHQAVAKMQILLNDLLELSRVGRIMSDPIETSFGEIVYEALALVEGNIKARGVRVEFVDEKHKIFGDRIRLIEVIQNLVENAIKFMGKQPKPRIDIGSKTDSKNKVIFFVQDNGMGIEPQYIERIFGLFNKLDANTSGSGIGLTLVKRIIEVHGGKVWVASQLDKGSTFYFTLS